MMNWIRGPLWDCFWMLSGLPIGLALATGQAPLPLIFAIFLALNSGHLVAPVAMAWSHRGFCQIMLAQKIKYIFIPIAIVAMGGVFGVTVGKTFPVNPVTLAVGIPEWKDYARPLVALLPLYFVWNTYHFGMQNYGFLRLYRPQMDRAAAMQWGMFATIFGLIVIPIILGQPRITLFLFGLVIVNHQLAAIGLASHIWANHWRRSPLWLASALICCGGGLVARFN